jgi:predicted MFS family arabinose efflux permease
MRIGKRDGLLSALRHRDLRVLIAAFAISASGSWAYNVGLSVYVYEQTKSAAWAGAVTVGRFVPSMLFGAYGGVLAERFERIGFMVRLDLVCTALMAGLTVLAALDGPAWAAIAIAGVNSTITMSYQPAVAATMPQLVPAKDLAAANTLQNTVENLAVIAGPAMGALLLLSGSVTFAFGVNAASFLFSAFLVARIKVRSEPVDVTEGGGAGPFRQMLVGVQAIAGSAAARLLVAYSVLASFVYGVDTVQFLFISREQLGTGSDGYGYLLAGLGVGGVAAAGLVNRISAWPRLGTAILAGMSLYCLPTLLFLTVNVPVGAFGIEVLRGAGTLVVDVLAITALQRSMPQDKLARVFGAFFTLVLLAITLGALVTPQILDHTSLDTTLWLAGLGIPAAAVLGWPMLRRMDNANVARLAELEPRIVVLQRAAILAEASRPVLERLAAGATELEVEAGRAVVTQGEEADAFYVIEDGGMTVMSHGEDGVERALPALGAGDYFGEIGLLEQMPRTATVTADGPSKVLRVGGDDFLDALSSGSASVSLLEGARTRLARTHPTHRPMAVVEADATSVLETADLAGNAD